MVFRPERIREMRRAMMTAPQSSACWHGAHTPGQFVCRSRVWSIESARRGTLQQLSTRERWILRALVLDLLLLGLAALGLIRRNPLILY